MRLSRLSWLGFFFWGRIGVFFQHSALAHSDQRSRRDFGRQLDIAGERQAAYCEWLARSVGLARMSDRFLLSGANSRARALELGAHHNRVKG